MLIGSSPRSPLRPAARAPGPRPRHQPRPSVASAGPGNSSESQTCRDVRVREIIRSPEAPRRPECVVRRADKLAQGRREHVATWHTLARDSRGHVYFLGGLLVPFGVFWGLWGPELAKLNLRRTRVLKHSKRTKRPRAN